jgi:hypothetical protein
MLNSNGYAFIIGMFTGVILLMLLLGFADSSVSRYKTAIAECEKSLPRDQHCKVVGVPVEKK